MQRLNRILAQAASLWVLLIVCVGTAHAQQQRPQTTVVNDTATPVTVVILNPPFPPLELNTIPAGDSSTIGAPAGSTIQIQNSQSGEVVKEIPVTKTRQVALTAPAPAQRKVPDAAPSMTKATRSGTSNSRGAPPGKDGTLHVILACDKDDVALGEGFEINEGLVRSQFLDTVATGNLRFHSPWNDSVPLNVQSLLDAIDNLEVTPDDTLMVYLACHGYWDENEQEHFFKLSNDNDTKVLLRETLIKHMKSRTTRFGLLVTDSCAAKDKLPSDRTAVASPEPPLEETAPLYQALFFDPQGFLDLSSSSPGELALYYNNDKDYKFGDKRVIKMPSRARNTPDGLGTLGSYSTFLNGVKMKGGIFTEAMASLLEKHKDETYGWKQFTDLLQDDVKARFKDELPDGQIKLAGGGSTFQETQTIAVNEWPSDPDDTNTSTAPDRKMAKGRDSGKSATPDPASFDASEKFGVTGYKNDKGGFLILEVIEDTPAARLGLKVGEVIEKVNNQPVNTPEELEEALAKAAATFRITVDGTSFVVRP